MVVNNQQLAVAWAKDHAPEAIKTVESVLVSKLPEKFTERWAGYEFGNGDTPWGFAIEPGRTSVKVTTVSSGE